MEIALNGQELLKGLNDRQREAVTHTEGPLLILAGAGSGKTRVITHRTGYLIENGVAPWNILAITFTNKAAAEMRERVDRLIGADASRIWVSTFHSMCVRLLRRDIDRLGYQKDFVIYDGDDQRTLVSRCIKKLDLDTRTYRARSLLGLISRQKNSFISAEEFESQADDFYDRNAAEVYLEYEKELKKNNALDFDDLLVKTAELFNKFPEVLGRWQERFRYIMVDEYQDTNMVQFEIVRLLSGRHRNLCVVGDDDQSIYKFRGADVGNILDFEKSFPGARVIKLEQNYRSTSAILNAANAVISNNTGRKAKALWTDNGAGTLPDYKEYDTAAAEAAAVIDCVRRSAANGTALKDQAVLYRTNAQSRLLEEKCVAKSIPYVIVGGVNFYQRKEIKDMLAYLRTVANPVDDLSVRRIVNVPRRGIGQTSVERIADFASSGDISFYEALTMAGRVPGLGSAAVRKVRGFVDFIEKLKEKLKKGILDLGGLTEYILEESGYRDELTKEDPVTAETRLQNIGELTSKAAGFEKEYRERLAVERDAGGSMEPGADDDGGYDAGLGTGYEAGYDNGYGAGYGAGAGAGYGTRVPDGSIRSDGFINDGFISEGSIDRDFLNEGFMDDGFLDEEPGSVDVDDGLAMLSAFLEEVSLVADIDRTSNTGDVLTMMTLHAAKGLEFDTVYLCGMEDGLFPSSAAIYADDPETEIEEERRLCYVGITRAKRVLHLSSARERMVNGEIKRMAVSRFIDEVPDDMVRKSFRGSRRNEETGGRESFAGFGGYEGRLNREQGYGFEGRFERGPGSRGSSGAAQASSDYYGGGFGSLDTSRTGRGSRSERRGTMGSGTRSVGTKGSGTGGRAAAASMGTGALKSAPGLKRGFSSASDNSSIKTVPDYRVGDRVSHTKFGNGVVTELKDEPRDYKVTVDFDEAGTRVMYAGFAKLKKL